MIRSPCGFHRAEEKKPKTFWCLPCCFLSSGSDAGYMLWTSSKISSCLFSNELNVRVHVLSSKNMNSVQYSTEIQMFIARRTHFSIVSFESSQLTGFFSRRVLLVALMDKPGLCPQASRRPWRWWVRLVDAVPEERKIWGGKHLYLFLSNFGQYFFFFN